MSTNISIVIPAYNEADGIGLTLERLIRVSAQKDWHMEMILVDDGSTDETGSIAQASGAMVLRNPMNGGYGLSLQRGIRAAKNDLIAITDADGTYPIEELPNLVHMVEVDGYNMAVGARQGSEYKRGWWKYPARIVFRWLAEYVAGRRIPDINSGLRVFRRQDSLPHLPNTCLGFSFTTSITLIYFLNGLFVGYRPIPYAKRIGATKVRHFWDTLRTAQIMVSVISLYNPLKLFLLIGAATGLTALASILIGVAGARLLFWPLAAALSGATAMILTLGCVVESARLNAKK